MGIAEIAVIVVLILSIVLHEVAHGYAANWLGDPTARLAGRLTANPLPHIDPIGSVLIPAMLFMTSSPFLFGWAKPVPYNPYNLNNQRWGEAIVAAAGPLTNLLLAFIFAIIIRFADPLGLSFSFVDLASYIVYINILLACFNLIPVPPLDGSKVIEPFLPLALRMRYRAFSAKVDQLGFIATFIFIFLVVTVLWGPFSSVVTTIFRALTGLPGF